MTLNVMLVHHVLNSSQIYSKLDVYPSKCHVTLRIHSTHGIGPFNSLYYLFLVPRVYIYKGTKYYDTTDQFYVGDCHVRGSKANNTTFNHHLKTSHNIYYTTDTSEHRIHDIVHKEYRTY